LANFDSSIKTQNLDYSQVLNLILSTSKTIKDDLTSLSNLLIGEHHQMSIVDELKTLFNILNYEIPTQMKATKDKFQIHFLDSITPYPLILVFIQNFSNFAVFSNNFIRLVQKIIPLQNYSTISRRDLFQKANDAFQQFDLILKSILNILFSQDSSSHW
jgi:hypothetical protein